MKKHRLVQVFVDPSTRELSASRLCLCLVVMIFVPVGMWVRVWAEIDIMGNLVGLAGVLAGIYAANSFGRTWKASSMVKAEAEVIEAETEAKVEDRQPHPRKPRPRPEGD